MTPVTTGTEQRTGATLNGIDASQVADVEATLVSAGVVLLAGLLLLRLLAPARFVALRHALRGSGPLLGAIVAVLATAASLWYSEGANFPPCELCWYQRIAMYPLAVILPIAAFRGDAGVRPYALSIAGIGLAVSAWHNYIETFPDRDPGGCDPANPCTIRWVEAFGFWTIPRMAAACFVLIIAALLVDRAPVPEEP